MVDFTLDPAVQALYMEALEDAVLALEASQNAFVLNSSDHFEPSQHEWEAAWVAAGNALPIPVGTELIWTYKNKYRGTYGVINDRITYVAFDLGSVLIQSDTILGFRHDSRNLFVLDASANQVYRVAPDGSAILESWITPATLINCVSLDGVYLYQRVNPSGATTGTLRRFNALTEAVVNYGSIAKPAVSGGFALFSRNMSNNNDVVVLAQDLANANAKIMFWNIVAGTLQTASVSIAGTGGATGVLWAYDTGTEYWVIVGNVTTSGQVHFYRINKGTLAEVSMTLLGSTQEVAYIGMDLINKVEDTGKVFIYFNRTALISPPVLYPYQTIDLATGVVSALFTDGDIYNHSHLRSIVDVNNVNIGRLMDDMRDDVIENALGNLASRINQRWFGVNFVGVLINSVSPDKQRLSLDKRQILNIRGTGTGAIRRLSERTVDPEDVHVIASTMVTTAANTFSLSVSGDAAADLADHDVLEFILEGRLSATSDLVKMLGVIGSGTEQNNWRQHGMLGIDAASYQNFNNTANGINGWGGTVGVVMRVFLVNAKQTSPAQARSHFIFMGTGMNGTAALARRAFNGVAVYANGNFLAQRLSGGTYTFSAIADNAGVVNFLAGTTLSVRGWRTDNWRGAKGGLA